MPVDTGAASPTRDQPGKAPNTAQMARERVTQGRLSFWSALTCFVGVVVGLALVIGLSGRTQLINNVLLEKSGGELASRSREIIRDLGYTDSPSDAWYGFAYDDSWERFIQARDTSASRWDSLRTGEIAVVGFRYRQSPQPLLPLDKQQVSFNDPPQTLSGMTSLILDGQGHLLTFFRFPPQVEESQKRSLLPPDWSAVFAAAGLNREGFQAVVPGWTPPYYSDIRAAWEGFIPGKSRIRVRIEASAYRGKLVYFEIVHPNSSSYRQIEPGASRTPWRHLGVPLFGCLAVLLSAGIILAHRPPEQESDRTTAFRLGLFVFLVTFLRNILLNHHLFSASEFRLLAEDVALSLFFASIGWLVCLAVLPLAKARLPHLVASCCRLLAGNVFDPVVGRDVLVGCLVGVTLSLAQYGKLLAPAILGRPPVFPQGGLACFAHLTNPVAGVLFAGNMAVFVGLGVFFAFALLKLSLRKDWAAATVIGLLLTIALARPVYELWTDVIFASLGSTALMFCLIRFGLLSQTVVFFVYALTFRELPITWHLNSWFANGTLLMLVLVFGLALCGFWISLWGGTTAPPQPSGSLSKDSASQSSKDSSAEREFLLKLLGHSNSPRDAHQNSNASQIDWARLFAITPTDLYAYLGHKLEGLGLEKQCPTELWNQTLDCRRLTTANWLRSSFELRRLAYDFNRHGVDFLLVKGAVLAFRSYPHYSLRPMSDVDIVLRPEGLKRGLDLIRAAGFSCPERFLLARPSRFAHCQYFPGNREISLPMQKPGTRCLIEVHTQLEMAEPWFPVETCLIWENTEEAIIDGLRVRTLERHEFLFHLLLHLARSDVFYNGLRPLLDVHLWVVQHCDRLDWAWLASEAVRRGYGGWVYLALKIICDTLKTPIPQSFFDRVPQPRQLERLQYLAYEQIWAERQADTFLASVLAQPEPKEAVFQLLRRAWLDSGRLSNPTIPPLETLRHGGLILGLRRAVADVRVKVPKYVRSLRNGSLSLPNVEQAKWLEKGRIEILQILIDRLHV